MTADEINLLALSIAKALNCTLSKSELCELCRLLHQIISNINTYLK